jgi:hypothetical protein
MLTENGSSSGFDSPTVIARNHLTGRDLMFDQARFEV